MSSKSLKMNNKKAQQFKVSTVGVVQYPGVRKSVKGSHECGTEHCYFFEYGINTYILVIFNLLFLLAGLTLTVIGWWCLTNQGYYSHFQSGTLYSVVIWTIICVGIFVSMISVIGIVSAVKTMTQLLKVGTHHNYPKIKNFFSK